MENYTLPLLEGDNPEIIETRLNMESLVADGRAIESELAEIVHRERSVRDFDKRGARSWIKTLLRVRQDVDRDGQSRAEEAVPLGRVAFRPGVILRIWLPRYPRHRRVACPCGSRSCPECRSP